MLVQAVSILPLPNRQAAFQRWDAWEYAIIMDGWYKALVPSLGQNTLESWRDNALTSDSDIILLGGIYLWLRRDLDWRIPVSILLTVMIFSACLNLFNAERFPDPLFSVFSGGLLLGAIYMATDPVSSPITPKGAWIFGIGVGVLVMLIRVFGGLPEGVMYAILLMNAATPLIDRYTQPRVFGRDKESS